MNTHNGVSDRIGILVSLVLTGVALSSQAALPSWRIEMSVLGSPLSIGLSLTWLVTAALVAMTATGMAQIVRLESGTAAVDLRFMSTFWILPCLVTLAAVAAVHGQTADPAAWLGSLVLIGLLLAAVLAAEHGTVNVSGPHYRTARLSLNIATYAAAFALYTTIYATQVRSLLSATAVVLVTFPLALELLRGTQEQTESTWLHAAIIALVTGQLTWSLNRWGLSSLAGGGLLLIAFYTMSGLSQQHLASRLNRRVVLEFSTIALLGVAMIWISSPWLRGGP